MRAYWRAVVVLVAAPVLLLVGCARAPERQWYKPNVAYTVADFERESKACLRDGRVEEACLRQAGWVPLTGDPDRRQEVNPHDQMRQPASRPRY